MWAHLHAGAPAQLIGRHDEYSASLVSFTFAARVKQFKKVNITARFQFIPAILRTVANHSLATQRYRELIVYYEAHEPHGLPYDPFKAIIAPRPIGWISTIDLAGVPNLAPYSFFNALSSRPPVLMFSSETMKDSARNARDTGEFVFSLATEKLQTEMNISSDTVPASQNEYLNAKLSMAKCNKVSAPRVAASPASMECVTLSCEELKDQHGNPIDTFLVIGQVVGIHINDDFIVDGRFDTAAANPLARCGYRDYASVKNVFELMRPTDGAVYDGTDR